jgi:hypothetical protein
MRAPTRHPSAASAPSKTPGDYFVEFLQEQFGWKPSPRPFHTTAKRVCGSCRGIKLGSEFDAPVTPGRPDLNVCRECSPLNEQ